MSRSECCLFKKKKKEGMRTTLEECTFSLGAGLGLRNIRTSHPHLHSVLLESGAWVF